MMYLVFGFRRSACAVSIMLHLWYDLMQLKCIFFTLHAAAVSCYGRRMYYVHSLILFFFLPFPFLPV